MLYEYENGFMKTCIRKRLVFNYHLSMYARGLEMPIIKCPIKFITYPYVFMYVHARGRRHALFVRVHERVIISLGRNNEREIVLRCGPSSLGKRGEHNDTKFPVTNDATTPTEYRRYHF